MSANCLPERKSVHQLAFDHYLRTGERLTNAEWLARERKFNPYHDELGRFASPPGVTVSWGQYGSPESSEAVRRRRVSRQDRRSFERLTGEDRDSDAQRTDLGSEEDGVNPDDSQREESGYHSEMVRDVVSPTTSHAETYFELNKGQVQLDQIRQQAGPNAAPDVRADLDDFQKRLDADRSRLDTRMQIADRQITEILRTGLAPFDVGAGITNIAEGDAELRDYLSASAIVPLGAMARQVGKTGVGREIAEGTSRAVTQLGGPHWKVKTLRGYHSHHIPADSVSPLRRGEGPSIAMTADDHARAASTGNRRSSQTYRQKQKDLIAKGDFQGAQKMDIDDIRSKFGDKYDDAIEQALEYTRTKGL